MYACQTGVRNVNVRQGFTDESTWRKALGNGEPLYCFSLSGARLDAPEVLPAGGCINKSSGPRQVCFWR